MNESLFTWKVWEHDGNVSVIETPTLEAFETQRWLFKEKGLSVSSLKRLPRKTTKID